MTRFWIQRGLFIALCWSIMLGCWVALCHALITPPPRLLFGGAQDQTLYIWQADCPTLLTACAHERVLLSGLYLHPVGEWSPDGEYVAVNLMDGWMIYRADCLLEGVSCTPTTLDPLANDTRVAWGMGGSTVAYMTSISDTTMNIRTRGCWDGSPPEACLVLSVQVASSGAMRQPTWSTDGRWLAFIGLQPRGLYLLDMGCLDVPDGCTDQLTLVAVSSGTPYWPSLSSDGQYILYFEQTSQGEQLYVADVKAQQTQPITFSQGGSSVPAWSLDERYLAYAGFGDLDSGDLGIYVVDLDRGLAVRAIFEVGKDFTYPAWSP